MRNMILQPGKLSLKDIYQLKEAKDPLELSKDSIKKVNHAREMIIKIIDSPKKVYGVNTGVGRLATNLIPISDLKMLQKNLLLSHAAGTGPLLSDNVVKLILLLKINCLAQGYSGVRVELIQALLNLYNHAIWPCIPSQGSVGASGDLAPLAHMGLPLLGLGGVRVKGKIISGCEGLNSAGLTPLELEPKEGLSLINGTQVSTGLLLEALYFAQNIFEAALLAGALSVVAYNGKMAPFDARIQSVRRFDAQSEVATLFRELLAGCDSLNQGKNSKRVQDPYSLRCIPQVMGASLHQLRYVAGVLASEVNAVTDNPLVFTEEQEIVSGGNFHAQSIALASDAFATAIAEIGSLSERRIALLINPAMGDLPAFLVKDSGLNSGFMIAHVTSAALVSENKSLAHPASVDSIPTSADQEDHVSMATYAARRCHQMLENVATVVAIELMAACQGIDLREKNQLPDNLQDIYQKIRAKVSFYEKDRIMADDIECIKRDILNGEIYVSQGIREEPLSIW